MKAIIGGVAGALVLGGALLLAIARPVSPAAPAPVQAPATLATGTGMFMSGPLVPTAGGVTPAYASAYGLAVQQQPVVVERIVYVDRPVTRTRVVTRPTTARTVVTHRRQPRSWKKSALIIGGSSAGGAGVGALLGGGSGAKKGAIVGGIGGLVYDLVTRNK